MWSFHLDNSQGRHRYGMILGRNILYELKIDLCFSNNTTRENGGTYEGCTNPMKIISKIHFNFSSDWL